MRHLLSTRDLGHDAAVALLDLAEDMAETQQRQVKKLPTLRGFTVVNLFFEDSTRTRTSFEVAANRLSADVITFTARGSSVSKGESLQDTAQTLSAMGADGFVIRHQASGAAHVLATSGWTDAAVINAGDGTHEHPTQALLDAFTMRRHVHAGASRGRDLNGVRVLIVGDVLHSRVARSNLWLLTALGASVRFVAPRTLLPTHIDGWPVEAGVDFDAALAEGPDVVMMLRVQKERMQNAFFPSAREYAALYGLSTARAARLPARTIVMHPGPMNRGLEIAGQVADSPASVVLEQVTNGISIRMAVLYSVLAGQPEPAARPEPAGRPEPAAPQARPAAVAGTEQERA